jgi:hypothetical protein
MQTVGPVSLSTSTCQPTQKQSILRFRTDETDKSDIDITLCSEIEEENSCYRGEVEAKTVL